MEFTKRSKSVSSKAPQQNCALGASDQKQQRKRRRKQRTEQQTSQSSGPSRSGLKRPTESAEGMTSKRTRPSNRRPPSDEALALSVKLKELSSQKRLNEALELYWDESNDLFRDCHHACIVVDCAARCGAIEEGEKVVEKIEKSGSQINIETKTALLKGFAHAGLMTKAEALFMEMSYCKEKRNRPNVRTLNTFLRGCLWSAASIAVNEQGERRIVGGVVSSEKAWNLCQAFADSSSYEYYIAQLCYALRIQDAKTKIDEMKTRYNVLTKRRHRIERYECEDKSVLETVAISMLSLARSLAVVGRIQEAHEAAKSSLNAVANCSSYQPDNPSFGIATGLAKASTGGKRAWRQDDGNNRRRLESNTLFRSHRLSEIRAEAELICRTPGRGAKESSAKDLARAIVSRLFYFSGGGTTGLCADNNDSHQSRPRVRPSVVHTDVMNASWHSFGLKPTVLGCSLDFKPPTDVGALKRTSCNALLEKLDLKDAMFIDSEGFLDLDLVFLDGAGHIKSARKSEVRDRALHIELGSGFGDWIVHQAQQNQSDDYVSVELRSDRVAQTFAKSMLIIPPLQNLCSVGAECGSFLQYRVRPGTVTSIFVNHPEPPTQTYGASEFALSSITSGGQEPAHMLNSSTLRFALCCLDRRRVGRLVVVTDNRWYARLICVTLVKALKGLNSTFASAKLDRKGFSSTETFRDSDGNAVVVLYQGQPSDAIGHAHPPRGSSYFDRLWMTGAGSHAEKRRRFVVMIEAVPVDEEAAGERQAKYSRKKSRKAGKRERERMKREKLDSRMPS